MPKPARSEHPRPKTEEHHIDDLRRMLFGRPSTQSSDLKHAVEGWQRQPAGRLVGALWAGRDGRIPKGVLMADQLVLLLTGKILHPVPEQEIVLHSVEFDTRADIVLELALEFPGDLPSRRPRRS